MHILVFSNIRLFSETLATCLASYNSMTEVIPCHEATRIKDILLEKSPNVILFDVTDDKALPELHALSEISFGTPILAMGVQETPEKVLACAEAGIDGYIPRNCTVEELLLIIEMALKGECSCHPKIAPHLFHELRKQGSCISTTEQTKHVPLTPRECEVLQLLSKGLSNKAIAQELLVSVATVKNHAHNIFSKLNVRGRTEVLAKLRDEPWLIHAA